MIDSRDFIAAKRKVLELLGVERPHLVLDLLDALGVAPVGCLGYLVDLDEIAREARDQLDTSKNAEFFRCWRATWERLSR